MLFKQSYPQEFGTASYLMGLGQAGEAMVPDHNGATGTDELRMLAITINTTAIGAASANCPAGAKCNCWWGAGAELHYAITALHEGQRPEIAYTGAHCRTHRPAGQWPVP